MEVIKPDTAEIKLMEAQKLEQEKYQSRKRAAIARQAQIYVRKHAALVSDIKFRDHVQTQQQDGLESRATRKAKQRAGTLHHQKPKRS